jgi:hypothetical protein
MISRYVGIHEIVEMVDQTVISFFEVGFKLVVQLESNRI